MGVTHHTGLIVWQLGDEIRVEVFRLTSRAVFAREFRTRAQLNDAANSICRNVAEGFAAGSNRAFARYLQISMGSLNELMDSLRGATQQGLINDTELTSLRQLARREFRALSRLMAHLRRAPGVQTE